MHQIEQTIYRLPQIVDILKQKYPEEEIGDRLRIPFSENGQVLQGGLSPTTKWLPWEYDPITKRPLPRKKVTLDLKEYERSNFVFVQAMKVKGFHKVSYIAVGVELEDLNGHQYTMPIKWFADCIDKIFGGWIVGQFKFIKHYGYRIEMVKDLWNEARQI